MRAGRRFHFSPVKKLILIDISTAQRTRRLNPLSKLANLAEHETVQLSATICSPIFSPKKPIEDRRGLTPPIATNAPNVAAVEPPPHAQRARDHRTAGFSLL